MDKSWITKRKYSIDYWKGCNSFLDFAFSNNHGQAEINCPCNKCMNRFYKDRETVFEHIICNGFLSDYVVWTSHGETFGSTEDVGYEGDGYVFEDEMIDMVNEAYGMGDESDRSTHEGPDEETKKYLKLLEDAREALYPGCERFTTLSFTVRLLQLKVLFGWSDKSFSKLLKLLKEAFPCGETLPKSYYIAKKLYDALGFRYVKYDACPNDCMLYWKDKKEDASCSVCKEPGYKVVEDEDDMGTKRRKNVPIKQMRYFPLKDRLKRLFMSTKTARSMRWHAEERVDDGVQRHPADSLAWKSFDKCHPGFSSDRRNVRLGLASDGFNPFRTISIVHSTWPIVFVIYNFDPKRCMKQPSFVLSALIDGPKAPGNDIDVYMQPMIEELKEFWTTGIATFDADCNEMFQLRAALMWTINDFPAYANLSGWSTKGALACPVCNKETESQWLKYSRKHFYGGNRRFLDAGHAFRKDATHFVGKTEMRPKPPLLSGEEIYQQVEHFENNFGKCECDSRGKRRKTSIGDASGEPSLNWKKRSIFFELPYWKDNLLRHNIDVMHVEKNILESFLSTLLGDEGKSKDGIKSRRDLQHLNIRKSLHPTDSSGSKASCPPAVFTLNNEQKRILCKVLKQTKFPADYASNISRCVNVKQRTVKGLKSHDCHVLMQQLLPIAIRRVLPLSVAKPIIELCNCFRQLCSKLMTLSDIDRLEERIVLTLCHLEKIFPPSFFDVMVHLPAHLAGEVRLAGLVAYRWMYPIERFLLTLKLYVRQRNFLEASIAEGYLAEECLTFCSRYLEEKVETKENRPTKYREVFLGEASKIFLEHKQWEQVRRYVLANSPIVDRFKEIHEKEVKKNNRRLNAHELKKKQNDEFADWFHDHVHQNIDSPDITEELLILSRGPSPYALSYSQGYAVSGLKFHTKRYGAGLKCQNTGVMLRASMPCYATAKDMRPRTGDVDYYGRVIDVIEVFYSPDIMFHMFRCEWVDNTKGKKVDELKFTLVNFKHLMYKNNTVSDEPYIFASQADQVWYSKDPIDPDWNVVVPMTPRYGFDPDMDDSRSSLTACPQADPYGEQELADADVLLAPDDVVVVEDNDGSEESLHDLAAMYDDIDDEEEEESDEDGDGDQSGKDEDGDGDGDGDTDDESSDSNYEEPDDEDSGDD